MRVENMTNAKGIKVPNQFIIIEEGRRLSDGGLLRRETFQSYDSIIAIRAVWPNTVEIVLDRDGWDFSSTAGKYRNLFLGETKRETERKIKDGTYQLADLNH